MHLILEVFWGGLWVHSLGQKKSSSKNVKKAWEKIVHLDRKFNILSLGLTEIDLRNSGQILGKVNIDKNLIFKKKNS